ncbi:hypothetical protein A2291_02005 [candidate division WOR-1 bacterium RIFOXYB2_FULL_42_35]|uniref:Trypsin n=1 Tax=candidate division WOR-1 bacterium RIFOXYC2_FULL_41_25 TaxID=1802586 RepID=A0A1F4TRQ6_UNCSA|nr:MAG: hypothetical protein A2247_03805 [candidate division WOR-1 bacterium RIFOXYA2_FULL_41_14]OGC25177.1 MAG: hypothetical protein A2291_02005 [candidate division WOR-1 bacterium RIFOXYB2_FULL_42_35]OGC34733.1 MAG: hypothetical protein A2462_03320 [candidate division WOR-1 bacterium RIFOXYC2_FULL_41_25]
MRIRSLVIGIGVVLGLILGANVVKADGFMIVEPRPVYQPWLKQPTPLSVKYHHVTVTINDNIATTTVDEVFLNDFDHEIEGTYIFPLPAEAAVTEFAMYVNGKKVSGQVLDKGQARKIYENIVRQMKDPALLEYVGRNLFKASIYPIPAKGEKRVQLTYKQVLTYDAGSYKYVYPLDTEKYSPKPVNDVTISTKINSKIPIKSLYSPSHNISSKIERYKASAGYEAQNVKPDKNFVLYYTVSDQDIGLSLQTYQQNSEDGYFMMLLSPGQLKSKASAKDLIFVLDTSGSMSGEKIRQAKEALRFCLSKLNSDDRFSVIGFETNINIYKQSLVSANDNNINKALEFVDQFEASGGTNINEALVKALGMIKWSTRPRMIVFLTDGEPTEGVTEMKDIIANVKNANKNKARLFVFGVGDDVNTHLLDKIAEDNRGACEYVDPGEDIEKSVSTFYSKINEPVLADIKLDFGGIRIYDLQPRVFPDIFKGTQLVLLGRYNGDGNRKITLTGYVNGRKKQFFYEAKFTREDSSNNFIPRLWATRKIGYLTSEIRLRGEKKELIDEIIKLSKKHGIMTEYTSYLVMENDQDYKRYGLNEAMAPKLKEAGNKFAQAMKSYTGSGAVSSARNIQDMQQKALPAAPELETVKYVGNKTFYLQDLTWTDSEYTQGMKTIKIKYLSQEYFALLKASPELGKYFAVGENIIVELKGTVYKIM